MNGLLRRLRTRKTFKLGDIIKSPYLSVCELIVDMRMEKGEMTYGTMYIEGLVDGMCSAVRCTEFHMIECLQYEVLYNVFDRRIK
jgi:hypothetical protein